MHRFFELLRTQGYGATGTCRPNPGVPEELVKLKSSDKNDTISIGDDILDVYRQWFGSTD